MKKFAKKLLAAALSAVLAVSVLAGCSSSVKPENYATTVVATFGDENIYLDEANMYLRAEQYYYEYIYTYMYGMTDIWDMEVAAGVTMADSVREGIMTILRQTYVLAAQAESLGVSLSEEDMATIEEGVDTVLADSDENLVAAYNLTRERMIEIYSKNALANLVWEALVADTDTNVADEDVRCVGASYVLVEEPDLKAEAEEGEVTDKRAAKIRAQEIYDAVKAGTSLADAAEAKDLTVTTTSYYTGEKAEENTLAHMALGMEEGAVELFQLEEGKGWYVMVLDTLMDEEATENKRQSVIAERQAKVFETKYAELQKNSPEFVVDEKVWENISMDAVFVVPEETEAADTTAAEAETTAAETTAEETTSAQ